MLVKAKQTLNSWQNRGLSLFGKVQVVNTLIASLFVSKMMVLPIIPDKIVKAMDNLIRDYIWGGKKAKVAYRTLQNSKVHGGVNLINLEKKDMTLKTTWPKILSKETEYEVLVYRNLRCSELGRDLWRCSLKPQDVKVFKKRDPFWLDVIRSWSRYNYYTEQRIENQLIWFNSRIYVNKQSVMWRDVYQRGLKFVYQLFQNKDYKSYEQVWQEYGLTKLRFNSLKKLIPLDWKQFFHQYQTSQFLPLPPHNYDQSLVFHSNWSQKVYQFLQEDVLIIQNKYVKWGQELSCPISDTLVEFGQHHKSLYAVTNVPKYRSFQYRLLQRALVTNIQLEKMGNNTQ